MRRFFSRVSLGLSLTYVIPLAGYVLLRGAPSHAPWWLDLADTFTLYLFIPTLPALLLGLLSFSRPTLLLCIVPIVLFLFLYGGLFLPRHSNSTELGVTFTVMTHNVEAGHSNHSRVTQATAESDPDIAAFQELTAETAEALTARLDSRYPYRALLPQADYSGVGILSRFPIVTEEYFTVGHLAQHLTLEVYGQNLHLFNVHPLPPEIRWTEARTSPPYMIRGFDTEWQTDQVAAIMEKVHEADGPIVLVGDFNITDQTRRYSQITQDLTDVYREIGWGFGHTFPANGRFLRLPLPLFRIDYVFHSDELVGLEARVSDSTGSDHLPIIARLSLK